MVFSCVHKWQDPKADIVQVAEEQKKLLILTTKRNTSVFKSRDETNL